MSWTEPKIQMLKDMWGHGYSASEIAKCIGGLSRNAVIGKAHRMELSKLQSPARHKDAPDVKSTSMVRTKPSKKVMLRAAPMLPKPPVQQAGSVPAVKRMTESLTKSAVSPLKTTERQCRWPHGDPRSKDFKFCGGDAVEGLPYCFDHARAAYQNFGRSRKREEEQQANALPQEAAV